MGQSGETTGWIVTPVERKLRNVTAPVVRRLRLSATQGSPAVARAAVGEVVLAAGLGAVLDEAILLATELVTNSVVHVGSDLEVDIVATAEAITVTVLDQQRAPLVFRGWEPASTEPGLPTDQLAERGRGLLLVDRFADCWGTIHHQGGKGVWFRLEKPIGAFGPSRPLKGNDRLRQATPPIKATGVPLGEAPFTGCPMPQAVAALGSVFSAAAGRTGLTEIGTELLRRLCEVTGADSATVLIDEADGHGARAIAGYAVEESGTAAPSRGAGPPGLSGGPLLTTIRLSRPWRGELMLAAPDPAYASPLAELTAERLALLIENHRLRRTDATRRAWLTFLAEASELLAQSLDVDLTLALIPRLIVPRLGEWCAIHSTNAEGELGLAAAVHADESQLGELMAILEGVAGQLGEALRTDGAVPIVAIDGYAVALVARGQRLGTLTVGPAARNSSGADEIAIVEDVAHRAALAIDNARIHADRRDVAQALQRSLLPPMLPSVAGVEFGAEYVPTGEGVDVGGDFYDVFAMSDRRWLAVVGDVSGKGVQAATVTGLVRDVTRVLVRDGRSLPEVLTRLNETLVERGGGRFCTLAIAVIAATPEGLVTVDLHLAGHDQPLLVSADGRASFVGRCGTALGLLKEVSSPESRVTLLPGDALVFYTDGVTERRRGAELFGQDRLRTYAASLAGYPAATLAARLRAVTLGFSPEPPRDDIAIFALRNDHAPVQDGGDSGWSAAS
jgi:serine phosphatase RsbU (regulator of sigma subunit)/anti-sigma regulatory factor (Ser/Thr protein kinase)